MAVCSRPASAAAVQQLSPSVTRRLVEARCSATSFLISFLRKPFTGSSLILRGRRSSLVDTAATNGCLPAAPRPRRPGRLLAGGTPAPPPRTVPTEVGVVHLDPALQPLPPLPLGHDVHDLLLQRPSVGLLDAETPAQLDRADAVLGGGDQPHRQEPCPERQLGGVEDRAGGERDLRSEEHTSEL